MLRRVGSLADQWPNFWGRGPILLNYVQVCLHASQADRGMPEFLFYPMTYITELSGWPSAGDMDAPTSIGSQETIAAKRNLEMAMDWRAITESDVRKACEIVEKQVLGHDRSAGLVIYAGERRLPVNEVLCQAYRSAKGLSSGVKVEFASGEASLNVLRRLGFRVERLGAHG